ncbi:MAG: TIGR00730 family Rossman fold protein, partial [Rhizobiales bacterium 24-66-13]
ALPGGVGTLEELVEQLTWAQLGQHQKPILVANIAGFWDPFLSLLDHMRANAFIRGTAPVNVLVAEDAGQILPMLQAAAAGVKEADIHAAASAAIEGM